MNRGEMSPVWMPKDAGGGDVSTPGHLRRSIVRLRNRLTDICKVHPERSEGSPERSEGPTFEGYLSLMRVGIGYDSHPFAAGRRLILGGVEIPNAKGLAGHSDADAVAHAVTDAILGAAGLGDIGRMFPNDNPQWKDASSIALLNKAYLKVVEAGFQFVHTDVTIILEQPKLARHVEAMEKKLAEALLTGPAQVSVKAKTNEGMGWIGRGEGIAVMAVATLAGPTV